jgi:hypothetical protein
MPARSGPNRLQPHGSAHEFAVGILYGHADGHADTVTIDVELPHTHGVANDDSEWFVEPEWFINPEPNANG